MSDKLSVGDKAPDFKFDTPWEEGLQLHEIVEKGKVLLIFLRYMGCPLCQMKISELIKDQDQFENKGVKVLVVLQSQPEVIREVTEKNKMPLTIVCDPQETVFKMYNVAVGSIFRYATPSVIRKAIRARKSGFEHGKHEGQEKQLPAVFLIDTDKNVKHVYYGKNVGDVPAVGNLLEML